MPLRSLPLDELEITVIVDNETDTLSSIDAGDPAVAGGRLVAAPDPAGRTARGPRLHHGVRPAVRRLPRPLGAADRPPRGSVAAPCSSTSDRTVTSGSTTRRAWGSTWRPSVPCSSLTGTGITAAACRSPSAPSPTPGGRRAWTFLSPSTCIPTAPISAGADADGHDGDAAGGAVVGRVGRRRRHGRSPRRRTPSRRRRLFPRQRCHRPDDELRARAGGPPHPPRRRRWNPIR